MKIIRQFGARRSGTNALKAFLRKNFDVDVHDHHKHWVPSPEELESSLSKGVEGIVISVKDPYAWMDSMIRWRQVCARNWAKWTNSYPPVNYNLKDGNYFVEDQCNIWNMCNIGWQNMFAYRLGSPVPVVIVRAEQLMTEPLEVASQLSGMLVLKPKGKIEPIKNVVAPGVKVTGTAFDTSYYTKKKYMSKLRELLPVINKRIDWMVADTLGYSRSN